MACIESMLTKRGSQCPPPKVFVSCAIISPWPPICNTYALMSCSFPLHNPPFAGPKSSVSFFASFRFVPPSLRARGVSVCPFLAGFPRNKWKTGRILSSYGVPGTIRTGFCASCRMVYEQLYIVGIIQRKQAIRKVGTVSNQASPTPSWKAWELLL